MFTVSMKWKLVSTIVNAKLPATPIFRTSLFHPLALQQVPPKAAQNAALMNIRRF